MLRAQSDRRHTGTTGGARRKAADDDVGSAPMRMEAAQRRARPGAPYVGRQVKLTHNPLAADRAGLAQRGYLDPMNPSPSAGLPSHKRHIAAEEVRALIGPVAQPVVLEIGCNDGSDSRELAAALPTARLHCFECDERALERFRRLPLPANLTLHTFAVGAKDGQATFHVSGGTNEATGRQDWDLSGSLKRPSGHKERYDWCSFDHTAVVEVRRLDSWLADQRLPLVDFIWLDVQGGEGDVFAGAPKTLRRTRFIYTEFNAWKKPLYEGDLTYAGTLAALGPTWKPLALYEGYNLLLRNEALAGEQASRA